MDFIRATFSGVPIAGYGVGIGIDFTPKKRRNELDSDEGP
jgi:hypothetical protein